MKNTITNGVGLPFLFSTKIIPNFSHFDSKSSGILSFKLCNFIWNNSLFCFLFSINLRRNCDTDNWKKLNCESQETSCSNVKNVEKSCITQQWNKCNRHDCVDQEMHFSNSFIRNHSGKHFWEPENREGISSGCNLKDINVKVERKLANQFSVFLNAMRFLNVSVLCITNIFCFLFQSP